MKYALTPAIDVELDLETVTAEQRQEIIDHSHTYGMKRSDFIRLLDADQVLESELRMAKLLEEEKSQHVCITCFVSPLCPLDYRSFFLL